MAYERLDVNDWFQGILMQCSLIGYVIFLFLFIFKGHSMGSLVDLLFYDNSNFQSFYSDEKYIW